MMPKKQKWMIWIVIFAAVTVLAVFYYDGTVRMNSGKTPSSYSVILYQNTDDEWETLLGGVHQAEEDFGVKINMITMEKDATVQEQEELIQREMDSGSEGILLAAVNSREIGSFLDYGEFQIPVVTVETGAYRELGTMAHISADDYAMGQAMGKKLLKDMAADEKGKKKLLIVKEYTERDSVEQRYEGIMDVLKESGEDIEIQDIARAPGDFDLSLFIGVHLEGQGEYIVTLDKYCTEQAIEARRRKNARSLEPEEKPSRLYGIGNTAQTVNALDNGLLQAFVYQNEFNMGYEGIRALVEKKDKGYFTQQPDILYELVTKETLYNSENERLLFPNV